MVSPSHAASSSTVPVSRLKSGSAGGPNGLPTKSLLRPSGGSVWVAGWLPLPWPKMRSVPALPPSTSPPLVNSETCPPATWTSNSSIGARAGVLTTWRLRLTNPLSPVIQSLPAPPDTYVSPRSRNVEPIRPASMMPSAAEPPPIRSSSAVTASDGVVAVVALDVVVPGVTADDVGAALAEDQVAALAAALDVATECADGGGRRDRRQVEQHDGVTTPGPGWP